VRKVLLTLIFRRLADDVFDEVRRFESIYCNPYKPWVCSLSTEWQAPSGLCQMSVQDDRLHWACSIDVQMHLGFPGIRESVGD